jgi:hypothetical protein
MAGDIGAAIEKANRLDGRDRRMPSGGLELAVKEERGARDVFRHLDGPADSTGHRANHGGHRRLPRCR